MTHIRHIRPRSGPTMIGRAGPPGRPGRDDREAGVEDFVAATYGPSRQVWYAAYLDTMPDHLRQLVALELHATDQRHWHPTLIHGLLQCREYAADVISDLHPGKSVREIQQLIRLRMQRAERFLAADGPRCAEFYVDESALVRGRPDVLRAQLAHLTGLCERWPGIRVQVVPLTTPAAIATPISIYRDAYEGAVYLEQHHEAQVSVDRDTVRQYSYALDHLAKRALGVDASLRLIHERWEALCTTIPKDGAPAPTAAPAVASRSDSRPAAPSE